MRVVIVNETYAPSMGYLSTMLPRYFARAGVDTHLISLDLPPYHYISDQKAAHSDFSVQQLPVPGTVEQRDGYTIHILGHGRRLGYVFANGLGAKLAELRPDIVYSTAAIGWLPLQCARAKLSFDFRLFTGSHTSAAVFPLAQRPRRWADPQLWRCLATRALPGRLVSWMTEVCYGPTADCCEIAWKYFGVERSKLKLVHLGVDTDTFKPVATEADRQRRAALRLELGVGEHEVLCIYTGKLSRMKNPWLLAEVTARLRTAGKPYRAMFIGDGEECARLQARGDCVVLGYMQFQKLGDYYRAADVGVWLTNESTSMLDAAACGIPIVVSDAIYQDHVTGNGLAYRMNDIDSLAERLELLGDPAKRAELGAAGARKMSQAFSWQRAAEVRLEDFRAAIARHRKASNP